MTFYKECIKRDASEKYGFSQNGLFAKEYIKKGEIVFKCNENECDYRHQGKYENGITRQELLAINDNHGLGQYSFMIDDDKFLLPKNCVGNEKKFACFCYLFNHSCQPNIGYGDEEMIDHIAIRDINIGDELTIDYQYFSTENSFYTGLNCKCQKRKCRGILKFNDYRNIEWQKEYYDYCGEYLHRKIKELTTKFYTSDCMVKDYSSANDSQTKYSLTSLNKLDKNEFVALFSSDIRPESHYINNSDKPNCYLDGNKVFTLECIEPGTELSIKYL